MVDCDERVELVTLAELVESVLVVAGLVSARPVRSRPRVPDQPVARDSVLSRCVARGAVAVGCVAAGGVSEGWAGAVALFDAAGSVCAADVRVACGFWAAAARSSLEDGRWVLVEAAPVGTADAVGGVAG
jgi:hypothetical protein